MAEHPILMSQFSMQAYLAGHKTQTRRVIQPQPWHIDSQAPGGTWCWSPSHKAKGLVPPELFQFPHVVWADMDGQWCPHGLSRFCPSQPGDHLWFREVWRVGAWNADDQSIAVDYRADNYARSELLYVEDEEQFDRLWEQSSEDAAKARLVLEDDGYHWEPGQAPTRWRPSIFMPRWAARCCPEILDVRVERVQDITDKDAWAEGAWWWRYDDAVGPPLYVADGECIECFHDLWDSINARRGFGWDINPWVWAYTFPELKRAGHAAR